MRLEALQLASGTGRLVDADGDWLRRPDHRRHVGREAEPRHSACVTRRRRSRARAKSNGRLQPCPCGRASSAGSATSPGSSSSTSTAISSTRRGSCSRAGDATAAIDVARGAARARSRDHGQALIVLGEARLAARDPQQAPRGVRARAEAARRRSSRARRARPRARRRSASYEVAIASLARAVDEAGGDRAILADAYRGLGIAWRRRGDLDKAIRELRKAVAEDGDDLDARAALGEALVADGGRIDEALRHLERAAAAEQPPALALYGARRGSRCSRTRPRSRASGSRSARALAETDATPLGHAAALDIAASRRATPRSPSAMRCAPTAFYLEALQLEPRRARAAREDRGRASRDRQPRRRARRATIARSRSAPDVDVPARGGRYRDRRRRYDARAAVGQRPARPGSRRTCARWSRAAPR